MPPTITNSFIVDALKKLALAEAVGQQQKLLASQFVGNPDGTFPCPHCFISGNKNTLSSNGINYMGVSEFSCDVCNAHFNVGS